MKRVLSIFIIVSLISSMPGVSDAKGFVRAVGQLPGPIMSGINGAAGTLSLNSAATLSSAELAVPTLGTPNVTIPLLDAPTPLQASPQVSQAARPVVAVKIHLKNIDRIKSRREIKSTKSPKKTESSPVLNSLTEKVEELHRAKSPNLSQSMLTRFFSGSVKRTGVVDVQFNAADESPESAEAHFFEPPESFEGVARVTLGDHIVQDLVPNAKKFPTPAMEKRLKTSLAVLRKKDLTNPSLKRDLVSHLTFAIARVRGAISLDEELVGGKSAIQAITWGKKPDIPSLAKLARFYARFASLTAYSATMTVNPVFLKWVSNEDVLSDLRRGTVDKVRNGLPEWKDFYEAYKNARDLTFYRGVTFAWIAGLGVGVTAVSSFHSLGIILAIAAAVASLRDLNMHFLLRPYNSDIDSVMNMLIGFKLPEESIPSSSFEAVSRVASKVLYSSLLGFPMGFGLSAFAWAGYFITDKEFLFASFTSSVVITLVALAGIKEWVDPDSKEKATGVTNQRARQNQRSGIASAGLLGLLALPGLAVTAYSVKLIGVSIGILAALFGVSFLMGKLAFKVGKRFGLWAKGGPNRGFILALPVLGIIILLATALGAAPAGYGPPILIAFFALLIGYAGGTGIN